MDRLQIDKTVNTVRPMPDMQQSRAVLSHNFVSQQSCSSDIASCPTSDKSSN